MLGQSPCLMHEPSEAPKGCSKSQLSAKEKAAAGNEADGDADMLKDEGAVEGLPAASTAQDQRKTSQQMRAAIAVDKGMLDQNLLLANPKLYYPEWFSLHYDDSQAAKQNRDGFMLIGISNDTNDIAALEAAPTLRPTPHSQPQQSLGPTHVPQPSRWGFSISLPLPSHSLSSFPLRFKIP